jgi:EmrB/QacA subfamily drug resistance transporter
MATTEIADAGHARLDHYERRWLALCVIAIAQLMVVLDASIVNIALPSAQADLGISNANRQWVITAYTLAFGGLLLLGGRIADYVGRKRTFIIGLIGFAGASALGGAAQTSAMLFGARALQGAFAALLAPAALSLVTVTFTEGKERARAFAVYGAISGGGLAIGLIVGGVLTEYASWRWCLLVNVPIAAVAAIWGWFVLSESKATGNTKYDIPGAILVTSGLVALVYGFTTAAKPGLGWLSGETLSILGLAVILLVAFVLVELRAENPLLPMRIVLNRNRGTAYTVAMMISAGLFGTFLFLTYYFQQTLGYSALKSGFAFLPLSAGIIGTAAAVSALLPRLGPKPLMVFGLLLATCGMVTLTTINQTSSWVAHVLPAEMMLSIGLACVFVPMAALSLVGIGNHDAGVASAMLNASQQVGGSLGTGLLNTIFASTVTAYLVSHVHGAAPTIEQTQLAYIHSYHVAFLVSAAFMLLSAALVAIFVNATKHDIHVDGAAVHVG